MLIMIAPEILYILGGEEYMQAVYVIPPVMIGYIAQMLYTLYVNIEYYNRKQKQIMAGTLIAAAINIILNLIFIPIFGYIAAAYTTLVGYIVLLFVHYAFVRHMKLESIYDMKFNISLLLYAMACGRLRNGMGRLRGRRAGTIQTADTEPALAGENEHGRI